MPTVATDAVGEQSASTAHRLHPDPASSTLVKPSSGPGASSVKLTPGSEVQSSTSPSSGSGSSPLTSPAAHTDGTSPSASASAADSDSEVDADSELEALARRVEQHLEEQLSSELADAGLGFVGAGYPYIQARLSSWCRRIDTYFVPNFISNTYLISKPEFICF